MIIATEVIYGKLTRPRMNKWFGTLLVNDKENLEYSLELHNTLEEAKNDANERSNYYRKILATTLIVKEQNQINLLGL